jgi:hypothetical protein
MARFFLLCSYGKERPDLYCHTFGPDPDLADKNSWQLHTAKKNRKSAEGTEKVRQAILLQ